MSTGFKKLSEVTLLETSSDNATVLIEEGGEIKRVPKKAVGGAGGYIIRLENSFIDDNGHYQMSESYDELYETLVAGGSAWADYTNVPVANPSTLVAVAETGLAAATNNGAYQSAVMVYYLTDVGLALLDTNSLMNNTMIYYPNGSYNLDPVVSEK